jgi:uncharacterized phage-like protein YoqJ
MNHLTCCFRGPNPKKLPYGGDERHPDCLRLKLVLVYELERMAERGVTRFLTGMMPGPDTWCAEFVLEMKEQNVDVMLSAYLPYEEQPIRWKNNDTERYFDILSQVDDVITLQTHYTSACMSKHRQCLLDASSFVLAVHDGGRDGTKYMLDCAESKGLGIVTVHPVTLERKYLPGTK